MASHPIDQFCCTYLYFGHRHCVVYVPPTTSSGPLVGPEMLTHVPIVCHLDKPWPALVIQLDPVAYND